MQYAPAAKFWDNTAEKYAKSPIRDMDSYTYTLERTRSYLAATDRVLELGCGTGSTALLLADAVAEITGADLSQNMIRIATRKAQEQGVKNARFVAAEVFDQAVNDGPYDVVMAFNLIHLIEDTPRTMRRFNDLLKPEGLFISKTVCLSEGGLPFRYRMLRLMLPAMQCLGRAPYVKFMKIEELEREVTAAGFKIIETGNYPASPPSRYIVAKRGQG